MSCSEWVFFGGEKLSHLMSMVDVFPSVNNIILYLLITAVFEALAVYLFRFRNIPGAMMLVYCQICKAIWILAKVLCSMSPDLSFKLFWIRVTEWMPLLLIYFWFEFIWEVSRQSGNRATAVQYTIRGIVITLILIIGFDGQLGWYYGPILLDGQVLTVAFGPAAWVTMIFCYSLNLLCLGLSVRWIYASKGLRRQQAIALSVTPLFNFVGNILGYTVTSQAISPQIIGHLLSALYVTWVFYRWRVYSILPLAQDAVTHTMIDGLVVVDEKGYIVDMNPAAKIIFTGLPAVVGDTFKKVVAAWPVLAEMEDSTGPETQEVVHGFATEQHFYQIRTIPLATPQGNPLGKTIILKDITRQKQNEKKMLEAEKTLAIMAERDRLGRELHDGRGQIWNYLNLELQTMRTSLAGGQFEDVEKRLERLIGVVKELNTNDRDSIVGLKKAAATGDDFAGTLQNYLTWYEKNNGIVTRLILPAEPIGNLFGLSGEVQLLRIIMEALTNIRKHAKARQAEIVIEKAERQTTVTIEDDGCGFDVEAGPVDKRSFGLQIMAERAQEAGGCLQIESKPGKGTKVIVQFCLE